MKAEFANELERALAGDSFAAAPSGILEGVSEDLAAREFAGVPRTIYAELWHIAFWQEISLDWVRGVETPNPGMAAEGFPSAEDVAKEPWGRLCERFARSLDEVAAVARDAEGLDVMVRCPSPAGQPDRMMTVREQLESLVGHNAYHFARIVLMRQMAEAWPPASGGFTW
jgi:DinB superfamily